ncbi:geranylgeranyl pyrophosphate synthetase [Podospora australis]|uniref:Geranylgeranyl pyrophosphate synthetase n=1 Tax=Podospora australis TaxID=1536484 RepID=A0AAN7AL54_9PEZI|nr:geranylgeranyl pyrophosphate synthetase [Podospora australis]
MPSPASNGDNIRRPTKVTTRSRDSRDPFPESRTRMSLFRRPSQKKQAAMASPAAFPSSSYSSSKALESASSAPPGEAVQSTPQSQAPAQNNIPFLHSSPALIPPRTTSSNFASSSAAPPISTKANLKTAPETNSNNQTNTHGHTRHRSRKASIASVAPTQSSFPPLTMSQPAQPLPDPSRFATEDFFLNTKRPWSEQKDAVLRGPFDYLNQQPGKDFRSALVKAFDAYLECPAESLEVITKVVSMLHTASLLVDDVEDNSQLRRGLPVAHTIFGIPQTINSSNYIYFCALQELQKLKNPKAISVFTEELLNLHRGQGMDLYWRDALICPTEDEYLEMVGNKTGGLFRLGIKLMQAESRSLIDCVPLVNIIGMIFQIADDYQNLFSTAYTANKGMCEDLTEGKFSFPVIHSIRSNPSNVQLLNILKQKTTNIDIKKYAVSYMESTGSFKYTKEVVKVLIARARKMADEIDEGKGRSVGVHKILDRIVIE